MEEVWHNQPPPPTRARSTGRYDWDVIVEELMAHPGEWRLVIEDASRGLPSAIKRKKMTALQNPDWSFLVATRNNDKEAGTADIWMSASPVGEGD